MDENDETDYYEDEEDDDEPENELEVGVASSTRPDGNRQQLVESDEEQQAGNSDLEAGLDEEAWPERDDDNPPTDGKQMLEEGGRPGHLEAGSAGSARNSSGVWAATGSAAGDLVRVKETGAGKRLRKGKDLGGFEEVEKGPPSRFKELKTAYSTNTGQSVFAGTGGELKEASSAPLLSSQYVGRVRENERLVELTPKLRILNQVEVCDIELFTSKPALSDSQEGEQKSSLSWLSKFNEREKDHEAVASALKEKEALDEIPFLVSWIDRVNGEATLEARSEQAMNCERQRNYTFQLRAIGCNGLYSNQ